MKNFLNKTFTKIFISIVLTSSTVLIASNLILNVQLKNRFQTFLEHQEEIGLGIRQPQNRELPPPKEPQFIKITNDFVSGYQRAILISSIIGILISAGFGFMVSKEITNPVKSLQNIIKQNSSQRYKLLAEVKGSQEIQELIREFNQLIEHINKIEKLREDLVSDVAHELKTPITKIRGKLEGIVDGIYETRPTIFQKHYQISLN
jgi:signal transduction histidine kinase